MNRRLKLGLGVAIIVAALGFLVLSAFSEGTTYFYTVDEVQARGQAAYGRSLRVHGDIVPESVEYDLSGPVLRFRIRGPHGGELAVVYRGIRPDNMNQAVSAIVEGRIDGGGAIQATKLMMQCPSRYEAA